jgi:hypothetical protein
MPTRLFDIPFLIGLPNVILGGFFSGLVHKTASLERDPPGADAGNTQVRHEGRCDSPHTEFICNLLRLINQAHGLRSLHTA